MGTFIVGAIVCIIALGAGVSIYRDKKAGRCSGGCSGCCKGCSAYKTEESDIL